MATTNWASSPSTNGSFTYDVFLNFRGADTRNNFISFLHKALKDTGINVFFDSEELWTGESIGSTLCSAIKGSKISIPVFSTGYADSKWCLWELAQIVQCHTSNNQLVLPIFFHVDPSQVRNQAGSFKEAFCKHEKKFNPDVIKNWRNALKVVADLKGEVLDETRNQAELVELVVRRILSELINSTQFAECKYPIRIDSSINDLQSLLNIGSNDVQFVGICGFGGIGKTTIAKEVYNCIFSNFKRHSFLSDIREQAEQYMGLVSLQKRFLRDIFQTDFDIVDYHKGKKLIEQRLCKEKVLVVLDDVNSQEQVDVLVGELYWFGPGSRVIITTRDEHILNVAKVDKDKIYWPQVLNHSQSLQLFSWHAFQKELPPEDYMQLSHDVAFHSGGLPLTLEVFGSYLSDISDKEEWKSTLQMLMKIPPEKVQRRLKISYDNLENDYQKAIFLDAACFFIGWEKETVISIWEACGYHPKSAIYRLIKRSLLKFEDDFFGRYSILKMHDQIRDMGREIVSEENRMELGKRSRLWSSDEILEVLEEHKGTGMIKGMSLPYSIPCPNLASEHFQMMPNLRFLNISFANFIGDFSHLPSALRCLTWRSCPWRIITNFYHKRLVYLDLSASNIEQAWNVKPQDENKWFEKLKALNLRSCPVLSKSPNFSWFPYLERLDLGYCGSLDMLDESIGQLSQLKYLILQCCKSLERLPDGVGLLEKLEVLDNRNCLGLKQLPRSMGRMRCLNSINWVNTSISEIPDDFAMLSNLEELKISSQKLQSLPADMSTLKNLKQLELCQCKKLKDLPKLPPSLVEVRGDYFYSLARLSDLLGQKNLTKLKVEVPDCEYLVKIHGLKETKPLEGLEALGCYNLTSTQRKTLGKGNLLPDRSPGDNYSLKQLSFFKCGNLEHLPELPSSLVELWCEGCESLEQLPDLSRLKNLKKLKLRDCVKLKEIRGLEGMESLEELDALGSYNLTDTPNKILGQGTLLTDKWSPGDGYSLTAADRICHNNSTGLILCIVFTCYFSHHDLETTIGLDISASIRKKDKTIRCHHTLRIEVEVKDCGGDIIYIHHFRGFDWFEIPFQGEDTIEILDIREAPKSIFPAPGICGVKFYKLLSRNKETDPQQTSCTYMSAMIVADFFNLSYVVEESFNYYWETVLPLRDQKYDKQRYIMNGIKRKHNFSSLIPYYRRRGEEKHNMQHIS